MIWNRAQKTALGAVTGLVVVGGIVSAALPHNSPGPARKETLLQRTLAEQATPVGVTTVHYGAITRTLTLTGTIQSPRTANVSAGAPGRAQGVYVSEGSQVNAGDLLVQLDPAQAQAQLAAAQDQVIAAQSAYDKAVSGRNLEAQKALSDVIQARLGVEQAQTGLSKARAGATAATIAGAEAQALQAHEAAGEASRALKRTQFLFQHGVVPQSTLDDVRTKAQQAQAAAEGADASVRQARQGASPQDIQLAQEKVAQAQQGLDAAIAAEQSRIAVANSDVQAASSQIAAAKQQQNLAHIQVEQTRVTAPIAGVVTAVRIHPGEAAMPGQPLVVITSLQNVYFESAVSETERLHLAPGQLASVTLTALPGRVIAGRVSEIVPAVNPGAAGFLLRINLAPSEVVIPPGTYARALIQTGSAARTLVVPTQAVLTDSTGHKYVYVIQNGAAEQRTVTTGITNPDKIEILSGLADGDRVVTTGAELIQPGARVNIENPTQTDSGGTAANQNTSPN